MIDDGVTRRGFLRAGAAAGIAGLAGCSAAGYNPFTDSQPTDTGNTGNTEDGDSWTEIPGSDTHTIAYNGTPPIYQAAQQAEDGYDLDEIIHGDDARWELLNGTFQLRVDNQEYVFNDITTGSPGQVMRDLFSAGWDEGDDADRSGAVFAQYPPYEKVGEHVRESSAQIPYTLRIDVSDDKGIVLTDESFEEDGFTFAGTIDEYVERYDIDRDT